VGSMDVRLEALLGVTAIFVPMVAGMALLGLPELAVFFALCLLVVLLAANGDSDHDNTAV
jgi:hypothetical protein